MKTSRATDRRVLRTHRMLRDALIALILERGWDEVSVQDVCDRADIGRSTFYMHFADKEDLLLSGFADLRKAMDEQRAASAAGTQALGFARAMIEHAHENQRLFRALVGKRSGQAVQKLFRQHVLDLVRQDLAGLAPPGPHLDATVHYLTGAFVELVVWSLDNRGSLQAPALAEHFHRLTGTVLATLRGARG
jgi:AcrR family transcriptional regulator